MKSKSRLSHIVEPSDVITGVNRVIKGLLDISYKISRYFSSNQRDYNIYNKCYRHLLISNIFSKSSPTYPQ